MEHSPFIPLTQIVHTPSIDPFENAVFIMDSKNEDAHFVKKHKANV